MGQRLGSDVSGTKASLFAGASGSGKYPIYCEEDVMSQKAHGTCEKPVQENLRWNCDRNTADRICCFNRHYAEHAGMYIIRLYT